MQYRKKIISALVLAFVVYGACLLTCTRTRHYELSRFVSPETCGGCHTDIYNQWKNSLHHLSHTDTVYRGIAAFMRQGLVDSDEIEEAESCVKCHTPVGVVSGNPRKTSDDLNKVPELAQKGIQCDYCHSATGAKQMYNNGIVLDPGRGENDPGIKRGPFRDSESDYHKSEFSEFHTSPKICGTCHDVRHVAFGTRLETTYEEWERGPYNTDDPAVRMTCQDCHMYQRPGIPATGSTPRIKNPGTAAVGSKERPHIFTHYFVGANSLLPSKNGDTVKAAMAEARLRNAATIEIDTRRADKGRIAIIVKNTGAGHFLPTGLTDFRQMWLEIIIRDAAGKIVYATGVPDNNGYLDDKTIIYNTIFGDDKGKPVVNVAKARKILKDRRIPPKGKLREPVIIPVTGWSRLTVSAKLNYRIAPPRILDQVFGRGKIAVPIITMAEANKTLVK